MKNKKIYISYSLQDTPKRINSLAKLLTNFGHTITYYDPKKPYTTSQLDVVDVVLLLPEIGPEEIENSDEFVTKVGRGQYSEVMRCLKTGKEVLLFHYAEESSILVSNIENAKIIEERTWKRGYAELFSKNTKWLAPNIILTEGNKRKLLRKKLLLTIK